MKTIIPQLIKVTHSKQLLQKSHQGLKIKSKLRNSIK